MIFNTFVWIFCIPFQSEEPPSSVPLPSPPNSHACSGSPASFCAPSGWVAVAVFNLNPVSPFPVISPLQSPQCIHPRKPSWRLGTPTYCTPGPSALGRGHPGVPSPNPPMLAGLTHAGCIHCLDVNLIKPCPLARTRCSPALIPVAGWLWGDGREGGSSPRAGLGGQGRARLGEVALPGCFPPGKCA